MLLMKPQQRGVVRQQSGNRRGFTAALLPWAMVFVLSLPVQTVQGQFSPSVSAGYWLNSHFKLRGNASHAFRVPSLTSYQEVQMVAMPGRAVVAGVEVAVYSGKK
jgi:hypothetical protein